MSRTIPPPSEQRTDAPAVDPPAASAAGRMVGDAAALVAGRLGVATLGWLGTLLIVRALSVDEFGRFTFIFGLLGLVATVTELGIGRVAVAGILEDKDPGAFAGTYVLLRGALGLLGYVVAVGAVALGGYSGDIVRATAVAGLVLVVATPSHAYVAVFQAHQRLRLMTPAAVLGQLGQVGLTAAIAASGGSVLVFTIPAVACEVVILLWYRQLARPLLRLRYRVRWAVWVALVREAVPLAIGGALATVYYRIDSVMLSKLDTFSSVGIYGVAYKFVDIVHFVPSAMMLATLPVLVRAWPDQPGQFAESFRRAFTVLVLVAMLFVVEFVLFAEPVIELLYGAEYSAAAGAASLVVGAECFAFFGSLAFTTLVAVGRHRLYPLVTLVGVVVNVGLNLWLIPARSFGGAALATLATEVVVVTLLWCALLRHADLRPSGLGPVLRTVPAGAVAALLGFGLRQVVLWPVAAGLTALAFVGLAAWWGAGGREGLRALVADGSAASR